MALNPGASIPAMLASRIAAHGAEVVLRKKDRGIWKAVTWAELGARVRQVDMALKAIGFGSGDVACVLAETRPEWVALDLGILAVGGISGGIHPNNEAEQIGHALRESAARLLFVENEEQLDKALVVRDACPALQRIVILEMKGLRDFADPICESFDDFLARGAGTNKDAWEGGIAAISADQPAVLLLPQSADARSRTLTHGETLRLVADAMTTLGLHTADERLAVLPMSDVMERVYGLYLALHSRTVSNYLESPDTAIENLQQVKPTVLGANEQFWERLLARTSQATTGATRVQRMLYRWAIAAGQHGGALSGLARVLVLHAVRRDLGFSRLRLAYVGAAPVAPEVQRWAAALGITIRQIDSQVTRARATDADHRAVVQEVQTT